MAQIIPVTTTRPGSARIPTAPTEPNVPRNLTFALALGLTTGIGLALILGGALGNLWDRMLNGRVVDFLLFYIGTYQWPAFNFADSAIVAGAGLLVIEILFAKPAAQEKIGSS